MSKVEYTSSARPFTHYSASFTHNILRASIKSADRVHARTVKIFKTIKCHFFPMFGMVEIAYPLTANDVKCLRQSKPHIPCRNIISG